MRSLTKREEWLKVPLLKLTWAQRFKITTEQCWDDKWEVTISIYRGARTKREGRPFKKHDGYQHVEGRFATRKEALQAGRAKREEMIARYHGKVTNMEVAK